MGSAINCSSSSPSRRTRTNYDRKSGGNFSHVPGFQLQMSRFQQSTASSILSEYRLRDDESATGDYRILPVRFPYGNQFTTISASKCFVPPNQSLAAIRSLPVKKSFVFAAGIIALTGLALTLSSSQVTAQKKGKSRPLTTAQLMSGLVKPQLVAIQGHAGGEKTPEGEDGWKSLTTSIALLNESSYTMMEDDRCPDKDLGRRLPDSPQGDRLWIAGSRQKRRRRSSRIHRRHHRFVQSLPH